jgi:hypothetical protein
VVYFRSFLDLPLNTGCTAMEEQAMAETEAVQRKEKEGEEGGH